MTTFKRLIEREQYIVDEKEQNFNNRVQLLYKLDEVTNMSADERSRIKDEVASSESYEKALTVELGQVRKSMKRHILKILEL